MRAGIFCDRVLFLETKEYQTFALKDIFPEYELKECMNRIKNILQKNGECNEIGDVFTEDGNSWFYTNGKNLHYFLEEDNDTNKNMKDKGDVKIQSCLNLGNSEKLGLICEVEKSELIDRLGSPKLPTDLD